MDCHLSSEGNKNTGNQLLVPPNRFCLFELDEQISGVDLTAGLDGQAGDLAIPFGTDGGLHLHGFHAQELLTSLDRVSCLNRHSDHHARHPGSNLIGVVRVCLGAGFGCWLQGSVNHRDISRLAVEFEEDGPATVRVRIADGQERDDQRLARLDVDGNLFARFEAGEEDGGRQTAGVAILAAMLDEVLEHLGIQQAGDDVLVGRFAAEEFPQRVAGGVEIGRRQRLAGSIEKLLAIPQKALLNFSGKPPGGCPIPPPIRSITDSGNEISRLSSRTSSFDKPLATMNRAMSPTAFEVGVTLTMSPNSWFTPA